ncbi:hypothetical protein B7P43_G11072 [Cryptotermes secundus]|uniref:Cyclin-L1 n=1 Tax=Cryptotermes secundus TaxID=105785 RepID=A0A2J7RF47_9NEOP|nr:hypothetical protein B7P43_G11072 [Cryptotermes secundus]
MEVRPGKEEKTRQKSYEASLMGFYIWDPRHFLFGVKLHFVLPLFHLGKPYSRQTQKEDVALCVQTIQPMILDQNYIALKTQVIKAERRVLKELGFCVHVKHPHKIIVLYLHVLGFEKHQNLMQLAWNYMNDSLRTDVFLRYQPETVACACIYLTSRKLNISLPKSPAWFSVFGVSEEDIQDVCFRILRLYKRPKVSGSKFVSGMGISNFVIMICFKEAKKAWRVGRHSFPARETSGNRNNHASDKHRSRSRSRTVSHSPPPKHSKKSKKNRDKGRYRSRSHSHDGRHAVERSRSQSYDRYDKYYTSSDKLSSKSRSKHLSRGLDDDRIRSKERR